MRENLKEKIKRRTTELGIEPKRSLGQNFLVSDSVVDRIIQNAVLKDFDHIVEIGPGLGSLTDRLIVAEKKLSLFELDSKFAQYWRDQGQNVIEGDALKNNWSGFPWENNKTILMSNLPYQISSRLVVELSLIHPCFDRMVLMFQKEVGQRLLAEPATEDYGLLTVIAQTFWNLRHILEAGAVDFMPKPNVASRVVRFDRKEVDIQLRNPSFLKFVKVSFEQRRKKLLPKLKSYQP
ncbi:MAG: 16S rRNA (adenine(1518)-N(6)/adenine(1519)-N(6))-dimethyltransferase RsmA, partial [Bdellovibrionales bacterium]|nr:16S rRNA (adenine(1518)-N(6)/adenine(1519)-N(6))-dimethyltransferase RsmA [Bdellovibrionales bacterium]